MRNFSPASAPPPVAAQWSRHRYVHVIGSAVWVADTAARTDWPVHFLGMLADADGGADSGGHGIAVWGVDVPPGLDPADGAAIDLYSYFGRVDEVDWVVAGRAVQVVEWARTHRYCGRCGTPTEPASTERAMRCPDCGLVAFPRLAPAMITLVTKGPPGPEQQVLLARGVQFRAPMYSCLAGFVEPGESLEQAVVREVREEVGIDVGHVRYWGSQPWPFPHSLMIGFRAEWVAGDIVCDPAEIVDAQWYHRDALPPVPPRISIARRLIDAWLDET